MKSKIPKTSASNNFALQSPVIETKGITFSFSILEKNEYFNLDATCTNWASDLFYVLQDISKKTKKELLNSRNNQTYRIHNHENANPPCPFPQNIDQKDCYQIRIGKSKGGIHGIFIDETFYVIWFDPLHNMYPDSRYGGLRKIVPPKTCCMDLEEKINELLEQNNKLQEDLNVYQELLK